MLRWPTCLDFSPVLTSHKKRTTCDKLESNMPRFADYKKFALRDLVIVTATIAFWMANSISPLNGASAIACGVLTGICALQFHEWGHIWGGLRCKADIYPPPRWWYPFIFSLDHTTNTREQFLQLSLPAFAATAIYISAFWLWLPREHLAGQTALIIGSITASLTVIIEFPLFARVYFGGSLPPVELFQRTSNTNIKKPLHP